LGKFGESPTFSVMLTGYWRLLMCLEFYLILKVAGAKQSLLWKMIIYSCDVSYRLLGWGCWSW
jgi:hypothetical protein